MKLLCERVDDEGRIRRRETIDFNVDSTIGRLFSGQGAAVRVEIVEASGDTVTYTVPEPDFLAEHVVVINVPVPRPKGTS